MQTLAVERGELAKRATDALKSPEVGAACGISRFCCGSSHPSHSMLALIQPHAEK